MTSTPLLCTAQHGVLPRVRARLSAAVAPQRFVLRHLWMVPGLVLQSLQLDLTTRDPATLADQHASHAVHQWRPGDFRSSALKYRPWSSNMGIFRADNINFCATDCLACRFRFVTQAARSAFCYEVLSICSAGLRPGQAPSRMEASRHKRSFVTRGYDGTKRQPVLP